MAESRQPWDGGRWQSANDGSATYRSYHVDSVYSYFAKFVGAENMTILSMVMRKLFPDYFETLQSLCDGVWFYPFNMLLCRKALYDEYF